MDTMAEAAQAALAAAAAAGGSSTGATATSTATSTLPVLKSVTSLHLCSHIFNGLLGAIFPALKTLKVSGSLLR
jgi:hypothetical protein